MGSPRRRSLNGGCAAGIRAAPHAVGMFTVVGLQTRVVIEDRRIE